MILLTVLAIFKQMPKSQKNFQLQKIKTLDICKGVGPQLLMQKPAVRNVDFFFK